MKDWTPPEILRARDLQRRGFTLVQIGIELNRSTSSVEHRLRRADPTIRFGKPRKLQKPRIQPPTSNELADARFQARMRAAIEAGLESPKC